MLATSFKNTPTYLNCHVAVEIEANLRKDLTSKFYDEPIDPEEDDEDEESVPKSDPKTVEEEYRKQYEMTRQLMNDTNSIPLQIEAPAKQPHDDADDEEEDEDEKLRSKRSVREFFSYEWLRDGLVVASSKLGDNQGFTLLANGTLKFQASNLTTGEYRCNVSYVVEKRFTIGPIISRATVVEVASECKASLMKCRKRKVIFHSRPSRFD